MAEARMNATDTSIVGQDEVPVPTQGDDTINMPLESNDSNEQEWSKTLKIVAKAVVSVKCRTSSAFDGSNAGQWQGTGFIIDKARGIVLTNRHVIGAGPVRSKIIFNSKEEINVKVVYRDPVHDFGFFKFDVKELDEAVFSELEELELVPDGAQVGVPLRVVGNDSGEQLSILAGTLARLDRNAPNYSGIYKDFNTFYYGAASSTSGGSSGSPVVNKHGQCIALNAGGSTKSANSYYLPLYRIARALEFVKQGLPVPRGTVQTVFVFQTFTHLRQHGLSKEEEVETKAHSKSNQTNLTGMLQVKKIAPRGPGDIVGLQEGDILLKINNEPIYSFVQLETHLDDCIEVANDFKQFGKKSVLFNEYCKKNKMEDILLNENEDLISMKIRMKTRRGTEILDRLIDVQDLIALNPKEFYTIAGGTFQAASYNIALWAKVPVGTVYYASMSILGAVARLPVKAFIKSVRMAKKNSDSKTKADKIAKKQKGDWDGFMSIREFVDVLLPLNHGDRLLIKYVWMGKPRRVHTAPGQYVLAYRSISRVFYDFPDLRWNTEILKQFEPPASRNLALIPAALRTESKEDEMTIDKKVFNSMVLLKFFTSERLDGSSVHACTGVGYVVDKLNGLVITSRCIVPSTFGLVFISVASEVMIPARILYCHPTMNFTLMQIDVVELYNRSKKVALELTAIRPTDQRMKQHQKFIFYGLSSDEKKLKDATCSVEYVTRVSSSESWPPTFKPRNTNVFIMDKTQKQAIGGVCCDPDGNVFSLFTYHSNWKLAAFDFAELLTEVERINMRCIPLSNLVAGAEKGAEIADATTGLEDDRLRFEFNEENAAGLKSSIVAHTLGFSLFSQVISTVRDAYDLSDERVDQITRKIEEKGLESKHVMAIARVVANTPAADKLSIGDLVMELDGEIIADVDDYQNVISKSYANEKHAVSTVIQRDEDELQLDLELHKLPVFGTNKFARFEGIRVQAMYPSLYYEGFVPEESERGGVFVVGVFTGTPASQYNMPYFVWIIKVNNIPTPDLDSFIEVVKDIGTNEDVRFLTVDNKGNKKVSVVKTDLFSTSVRVYERELTTLEWKILEV